MNEFKRIRVKKIPVDSKIPKIYVEQNFHAKTASVKKRILDRSTELLKYSDSFR